jgi:hypothetical protein
MENKKQSSVEWLIDELWNTPKDKFEWHSILRKAKAMHKEEIKDAWNDGHTEGMEGGYSGTYEEYYKETFGGQDNEN